MKEKQMKSPTNEVIVFLTTVGCVVQEQSLSQILSKSCINKAHNLVEVYDYLLVTTRHFSLMTNDQLKQRPVIKLH